MGDRSCEPRHRKSGERLMPQAEEDRFITLDNVAHRYRGIGTDFYREEETLFERFASLKVKKQRALD